MSRCLWLSPPKQTTLIPPLTPLTPPHQPTHHSLWQAKPPLCSAHWAALFSPTAGFSPCRQIWRPQDWSGPPTPSAHSPSRCLPSHTTPQGPATANNAVKQTYFWTCNKKQVCFMKYTSHYSTITCNNKLKQAHFPTTPVWLHTTPQE